MDAAIRRIGEFRISESLCNYRHAGARRVMKGSSEQLTLTQNCGNGLERMVNARRLVFVGKLPYLSKKCPERMPNQFLVQSELKAEMESIQQQMGEAKKNERANVLKEVKRLCKEFGFTAGMLQGSLAKGWGKSD